MKPGVLQSFALASMIAATACGSDVSGTASGDVRDSLVISQAYVGGLGGSAPYAHDFIEIFNRGREPVSLRGLRVGGLSSKMILAVPMPDDAILQPGQHFLVQFGSFGRPRQGADLPSPDFVGPNPELGSSLSQGIDTLFIMPPDPDLVACARDVEGCDLIDRLDFRIEGEQVGEESAAVILSAEGAAQRRDEGCSDTNSKDDFRVGPPQPRSSASEATPCGGASWSGGGR